MRDIALTVSDGWLMVLLVPGLVFLAYLVYRSDLRGLGAWLLGIRVAVLLLGVALLMAPILALTVQTQRKPLVAVLVDDSESMKLADGEVVRSQTALAVLQNPAVKALAERARVVFYHFSDVLTPFTDAAELQWQGRATDMAGALDGVREQTAGQGLAQVVMISDGGQNLGGRPERAAVELGVPVLSVGVGDPVAPKDVAVVSTVLDPLGYVGREQILQVRVRATGYDQGQTLLRVTVGGREVASKPIALRDGEQALTFALHPDHPGRYAYEVSVTPQQGERTLENNRMLVSTEVLESRLRVLVLAGQASADLAYLRRVWSADANLELHVVVREQPSGWAQEVQTALRDLKQLDAVIVINVPQAELAGQPEQDLVAYVKKGGALLAIGGDASFEARYALSPLADVLPMVFEKVTRTFVEESFPVYLPEASVRHPVMRLSDDPLMDRESWAELPPLLSYNRVAGLATDATVLLAHGVMRLEGQPMPLVAVRRVGAGKTMAVAYQTFWRFGLMMWGIGKNDALSQTFWTNAMRWLVTRDELSRVRVTTDQAGYRSGEAVTVHAQVFDPLMQPMVGARVQAVVIDSSGTRNVSLRDECEGRYVGDVGGFPQGDYAFQVRATMADGVTEEGTGHFTVGRYSLEYETVRMNAELMGDIAARSGGQYVLPEGLGEAVTQLTLAPEPIVENYKLRLWGHRWPLFVLVGLLALEWGIRRRRGMI